MISPKKINDLPNEFTWSSIIMCIIFSPKCSAASAFLERSNVEDTSLSRSLFQEGSTSKQAQLFFVFIFCMNIWYQRNFHILCQKASSRSVKTYVFNDDIIQLNATWWSGRQTKKISKSNANWTVPFINKITLTKPYKQVVKHISISNSWPLTKLMPCLSMVSSFFETIFSNRASGYTNKWAGSRNLSVREIPSFAALEMHRFSLKCSRTLWESGKTACIPEH